MEGRQIKSENFGILIPLKLKKRIESYPWCRGVVGCRRRVVRGGLVIGGGMVGSRVRVRREGDSHENCRQHNKAKHLLFLICF